MKKTTARSSNLTADLVAGLTVGIANVPDGMASAILAGANPLYGLYAIMVGTPVGALLSSSQFMCVANTSALAITAGAALAGLEAEAYARGLFTLTVLTGLAMILAGVLHLGRLMRFVSHSVMTGFLTGVSLLVVLSQLGDFSGYSSPYSNKVIKAIDLVLHPRQIDPQTFAIGILTVLTILIFNRTRLRNYAMLIGIILASATTVAFGWESVPRVGDVADVVGGLPRPVLPDPALIPRLLVPAISLAVIGLVQGAGVSKGNPNPDGTYPEISRDFIGQGAANLAAGVFQGMPVGGSVGSTALNVSAGARSRWANIFSGIVVGLIVLLFGRLIEQVAMPAMAALLIVAGVQSIKIEEIMDVWDVGWLPRTVMLTILALALIVPVQYAVFAGVVLSGIAHILTSSQQIRLVELVPAPDGSLREQPPPAQLPARAITMLQCYGSLFYASVENLEDKLPSPKNVERPVVILRLRQHDEIGSTVIKLLERYETQIKAVGGKLILAGVSPRVKEQLDITETTQDILGDEDIFMATPVLRQSIDNAYAAAQAWLDQET